MRLLEPLDTSWLHQWNALERKLEVFIDDLLHYIINKYDYTTYFIN